jgi:hypothetical protein
MASNSSGNTTRPTLSPLQFRLEEGLSKPPPLSRTSSIDSQTSLEDVQGLDVAQEIHRVSSPVARFLNSVEDHDANFPSFSYSSMEAENAASVIQRWVQNVQRVSKALVGMEAHSVSSAAARLFGGKGISVEGSLLEKLKACASSEEAITLSSTPEAAKDATAFLMGLPRDSMLRKLNVALHGPRAFLVALLVVSRPDVVLGEAHASPEGKGLANASRMMVDAGLRLTEVLLEPHEQSPRPHDAASSMGPERGAPGRLRRFRFRLVMCRFARRYHATAFMAWKTFDAERVVSQVRLVP